MHAALKRWGASERALIAHDYLRCRVEQPSLGSQTAAGGNHVTTQIDPGPPSALSGQHEAIFQNDSAIM